MYVHRVENHRVGGQINNEFCKLKNFHPTSFYKILYNLELFIKYITA